MHNLKFLYAILINNNKIMTENFIKKIFIEKSRNIVNLEIVLSNTSRQHLILTGKKWKWHKLLKEINKYLINIEIGKFQEFEQRLINLERYKNEICQPHISEDQRLEFEHAIKESENWIQTFSSNKIEFSGPINSITQNK
ncbi:MAG: hypothetical protein IPO65_18205 [Saprospiraceae bacterium]|nr:hypothetical protein [Saprospiraceae bacterium]